MKKVPPSKKLRKEIDEILSGQVSEEEDVSQLRGAEESYPSEFMTKIDVLNPQL